MKSCSMPDFTMSQTNIINEAIYEKDMCASHDSCEHRGIALKYSIINSM